MESTFLTDETCDLKLVTDGIEWPNAISIQTEDPAKGMDDSRSFQQMLDQRRAAREKGDVRVTITMVGRFETFQMLRKYLLNGLFTGFGFGHLATFPAQIHYKTLTDVVITTVLEKSPGSGSR